MKKAISLAGLIVILFLLAGCDEGKAIPGNGYSDRYNKPDVKLLANNTGSYKYFYVIDKNTEVVYLQFEGDRRGGITVALNADGTPVTVEQLEMDERNQKYEN